jgi:hypothetical protein
MKFVTGIIIGIMLTLSTFYYFGNEAQSHMEVETLTRSIIK